jgi:heterodisulfide reductase subunit C
MTEAAATKEEGRVRASEISRGFKYEVSKVHGGEKLLKCFQCGTCTSDCPIARFSDTYRPRQIIRMAQIGLKEKVLSSDTLWLCASCFTCTDRCPQDVEVANVIRVLKNLAAKQGYLPRNFKELGSAILETGYAYRIPDLRIKKREELGLPPLPKSNPQSLGKTLREASFPKLIRKEGE